MGLVLPCGDDQALNLRRKLVGVAHWTAGPVAQGFHTVPLITVPDLVTGLAGNTEISTNRTHAFSIKKTGDETKTFLHFGHLLPRHRHLPTKRKVLPMCPERSVTYI